MLVFWAYTIFAVYFHIPPKSFYVYFFTRVLIGVVNPVLLINGLMLILIAIQHITNHRFQANLVVSGILSAFASYQIGEQYSFWIIANFFYFPIDNDDNKNDPEQRELTWIKRILKNHLASFCIRVILILNVILLITYITNNLFIQKYSGTDCSKLDESYDCFLIGTREYIDCYNSTYIGGIDCYRFVNVEIMLKIDPLYYLIHSIFLFIATEKILVILFSLMKIFLEIWQSKVWTIVTLLLGLLMIIVSILCIIVSYTQHTGFTFLSVLQFTIISLAVLFAGILLMFGSPMEIILKENQQITLKSCFGDEKQIRDKLITKRYY